MGRGRERGAGADIILLKENSGFGSIGKNKETACWRKKKKKKPQNWHFKLLVFIYGNHLTGSSHSFQKLGVVISQAF